MSIHYVGQNQSGFQIHVRSAFWIAPLMSLAPNSPLHFSRFLKNHFPVNLSRSKSQYLSNIFWQMFYNHWELLFWHANEVWKIWIHVLAATWQVTNKNASKQSAWVSEWPRATNLDRVQSHNRRKPTDDVGRMGQNMLEWNMGGNFNFIEQ
jgi:hypothetical protein